VHPASNRWTIFQMLEVKRIAAGKRALVKI